MISIPPRPLATRARNKVDLEHEDAEARAELLAEELTDAELQELLRRLGQAEFGGSDPATVAAVVEATGRDLVEIGRILGDIRREAYDQRFGSRLRSYEQRLERLEDRVARPAPATVEPDPPRHVEDQDRGFAGLARNFKRSPNSLTQLTREEAEMMRDLVDQQEDARRWARYLWLLVALVVLLWLVSSQLGLHGRF
jgi:hypothetical protein